MYIKRNLEEIINKYIETPEIIAIVGARQTGKTTLLKHVQENIKNSTFITFEDVKIRTLFDRDIDAFIELHINPYQHIFIDEFQYARKGGQSLKFIYDTTHNKKIFISGSSVLELTVNAVKYLAGRIFSFNLYPFGFQEYLSYKNPHLYEYYKKIEQDKKLDNVLIEKFYSLLEDFIIYGGYPRVVIAKGTEEKKEVLKNILNVYLLKDVKDSFRLADDYKIFNLIKSLSLQTGNVISYNELSSTTQQSFSLLKRSLSLIEKTYIIALLRPFFTNKRIELVKNPKVYFYDTGLRNAVIDDFKKMDARQDSGSLYENFIFTEFTKKNFNVKYWRTKSKAEVDFIINDKIPVEVKSNLNRLTIGKPLLSFIEKYKPEEAFIFNRNIVEKIKVNNTKVRFLYHFSKYEQKTIEGYQNY
ncbi:hypothetical protein AUJ66_02180 [Candidatus Desantisbacteria bacterium CG1_02_38_46]|uniref:ATPase n=3 Tax=unclassified Candidatus Desantisiibacteriota TaxID=3106372 RepID=A0A2H9P9X1_9BACT|nr:MAG: hypothetical protein AUJ66_02180 [Candidatus Desantisbacteria bacterium CG1_02_38_46]PIU51522.1 MAG: hypothetical protein COS91_03975 [Candidatus Desantisbacteria bacterium CG07_land_8_20_14_0_80_39_15]PIZ15080.1 MAG: hypothetical protein COY51_06330 [Candidatus Desantisbacteria bacterium CG_4_10_14_0_8_um_filter_39_17]